MKFQMAVMHNGSKKYSISNIKAVLQKQAIYVAQSCFILLFIYSRFPFCTCGKMKFLWIINACHMYTRKTI